MVAHHRVRPTAVAVVRSLVAFLAFAPIVLLTGLGTGCRVMKSAAELPAQTVRAVTPGRKGNVAADPMVVQESLLRMADELATGMTQGIEKLRRGTSRPNVEQVLKWKIDAAAKICNLASGPNHLANLIDMTVFVTVTRITLHEYWQPKLFGESADPLMETLRNAETDVWQLVGTVLTSEQQIELHEAITLSQKENSPGETFLTGDAVRFTAKVTKANQANQGAPATLFSVLKVDPLSSMEPAVREIAQTRLFAERVLYVTQHMAVILRWQVELLSINIVEIPTVRQLVTNTTQLTTSIERFVTVAEKLPQRVGIERKEILQALQSQEKELTTLAAQVREAITGGTEMSTSLNTTLKTFDALMKRFGVGETNHASAAKTNSEPFRIRDYTETAVQLEATARQLTELLRSLDRTIGATNLAQLSTQVGSVVQQAQIGGREIVDYAFRKAILLVAALLVAGLVYRFLSFRLMPATFSKVNSK